MGGVNGDLMVINRDINGDLMGILIPWGVYPLVMVIFFRDMKKVI